MKMNEDEIIKLLNTIIGRTEAMGCSSIDSDILENLNILIAVTTTLILWVKWSSETKDSHAASERTIGETAYKALKDFRDMIDDTLYREENADETV